MIAEDFAKAPPEHIRRAWMETVKLGFPLQHDAYLERHGLDSLPEPEYVDAESAVFWKALPPPGDARQLKDIPVAEHVYVRTIQRATPDAIVYRLDRDWLLAPPEPSRRLGGSETVAGVAAAAEEMALQADQPRKSQRPFKCPFEGCRVSYSTPRRLRKHQKAAHSNTEDNNNG